MSHPDPHNDPENTHPPRKHSAKKEEPWRKHWKGKEHLLEMLGPKSKALAKKKGDTKPHKWTQGDSDNLRGK